MSILSSIMSEKPSIIVPDIPISEYPDVSPPPRKLHFWERSKDRRDEINFALFTQIEKSLVESNWRVAEEMSLIQREVGEWAWRNFKDKAAGLNPHLGVIEEVGELSKAILKKDQGIRGTPEKHDSDAIDAIGDIMIYLFNFLNTHKTDVFELASNTNLNTALFAYENVKDRKELVLLISKAASRLEEDARACGRLLMYLEVMSRLYGHNLLAVVRKTWDIVKKRNWVEDSIVGGGHTH